MPNRGEDTEQEESKLAKATKRLQALKDGNAYYEGDSEEGFGFVDGYSAACTDFEEILKEFITD